ncbi:MAG: hypothetical protein Q9227_002942 [Pyrenula ochraceoflavens]
MKARLGAALTPLIITGTQNPKYSGDPDSPNFQPPSPLISRPKFSGETEEALQKACAHIVAEVKLSEEGNTKQPANKTTTQTKSQKHDKHSSFSFQKAKGYLPETAAASFNKTTNRGRQTIRAGKFAEGFEPLEPTSTRIGAQKKRTSSSREDAALTEIRNKLELRPKTSAAACIDYAGDETSGSSSQSSRATAITSANMTPGQNSKRLSQGLDYFEAKSVEQTNGHVSGVDAAFKDNGLELLAAESSAMQEGKVSHRAAPAMSSNPLPMSSKTKSVSHLPVHGAGSGKQSLELPCPVVRKVPSVPNITRKVQPREAESSQSSYTSYFGVSNVPSNSVTNTRPGTSHASRTRDDSDDPPGRTSNIANSIREYIRPSTSSSRAPSRSRAPSLRSQRSRSSLRGNQESGRSWSALRKKVSNLSLRTHSRSSSRSRPGYDDGDEYFIDVDKVDLNKNLPPLPGLDTWDSRPKHIGELMKKALPKRSKRDTANVVIDNNGLERIMSVEEQVQRRQDLAKAVMEKMTTGSMGSGDKSADNSRPVSSSTPADGPKMDQHAEQETQTAKHKRHHSTNSFRQDFPANQNTIGQVSIQRGRSVPDSAEGQTKLPPRTTKHGHSRGKSRRLIDLLGFGKSSKNRNNAVQVV